MVVRPVIALVGEFGEGEGSAAANLERRGLEVRFARSFWEAEALLTAPDLDVAVVEVDGGAGSGIALLRRFGRENGPFFLLVSKRPDVVEKVLALELGAADFVESSISARELAARISRLVARRGKGGGDLVVLENTTIDLKAALVMHRSGEEETLSPGQVALLRLFLENPGKVLTRDDIMAAAPAESAEAFDRSIDSRIVRLRRKLSTERIATIRGTGYRFDPPGNAQ
jgi:two-component system, OmpR family, response regulator